MTANGSLFSITSVGKPSLLCEDFVRIVLVGPVRLVVKRITCRSFELRYLKAKNVAP